MKSYWGLCILMLTGSAWANSVEALKHVNRGVRWRAVAQYQKAIEEFEQAYQEEATPSYLSWIAQTYERLANLPTKSAAEVLAAKQQALVVYESFIETAPAGEPGLDVARSRMDPLRQEIKELAAQAAERDATLKAINDKLDLLINEVRALRELLLRREHGVRTATPAGFML
jgi:tetratricopeptide (TPR) repeat protein